ncbi:MAG: nuclear transport factor 2 family protein [Xanthomonadales bacterium]
MHRFILLALLIAATPLAADTASDIRDALDYYAEVWNENDLEAIEGYYHQDFVLVSDDGVFSRKQRIDGIRELVSGGGDRGRLDYAEVTVEELGDTHAVAYGRLSLRFKDGSMLESWFTTVYVKTPFGWKALLTRN